MKLRIRFAFAALCLLSGSGWLLSQWQPATIPGPSPIALRSGFLALTFWTVHRAIPTSGRHRLGTKLLLPLLGWFALMAGLPAVAVLSATRHLPQLTETFVFTLVPVFVVFLASQSPASFGAQKSPLSLLAPALAGVAGAAFLLPMHLPGAATGQAWLVGLLITAALSAWSAVQLHKRLAGVPVLPAAALLSASIALLAGPLCLVEAGQIPPWSASAIQVELQRSLIFDGPVTLLSVWLLRELSPVAFSARYLLGIAVTVAEGYLMLRPETTWTTGFGLLLLLASGVWLLLPDSQEVS